MQTQCVVSAGRARISRALCLLPLLCWVVFARAQAPESQATVRYDAQARTFRIDGGGVTYAFGVNESGELQSIYWGKHLAVSDSFQTPHSLPPLAAFTPSINTTPQEFTGWGGGLYAVPDLKITFPDGNRDLVLHYVSHEIKGSHFFSQMGLQPQLDRAGLARCAAG